MGARGRELLGLLPVTVLVTAGFTAVVLSNTTGDQIDKATITYGLVFLGACLVAHLFIRARLPNADPYVFPLAALLAAFGLVEIYRIKPDLAIKQAGWFGVGLALFVITILFLRDIRTLERYRYTIAIAGILLLLSPLSPIGQTVNGAHLSIGAGSFSVQPTEFAKLALVIFLASYLNDVRDVLVVGGRIPRVSVKHLGPMLVVFGLAMVMLLFIRDLGSSLMFFGAFMALLYVATNRVSLVLPPLAAFVALAYFVGKSVPHVQDRVQAWLHPFDQHLYDMPGGSYQLAQSLFSQADGGLFGRGLGEALITQTNGQPIVPAAHTDLIYAVIVNELGLFGAVGLVLVYLLFVARGFKTATLATDGFSKLLAAGLTAVFAFQVFVIVGGVTKVIPLTGVTLPFVSYGGSSILANFVLLALLLMVSDRARREVAR
jgi:cell division protein FtsW (lipid II flippase)